MSLRSTMVGIATAFHILVLSSSFGAPVSSQYSVTEITYPHRNLYSQAMNGRGECCGVYIGFPDRKAHAMLYTNGIVKDIGTLGGAYSYAWAIDASGNVYGHSITADNKAGNFKYDGTIHKCPWFINLSACSGNGQIAGAIHGHAAVLIDGTVKDLGTLGGGESALSRINDKGDGCGYSFTTNNEIHALFYKNGKISDLGTLPGDHFSEACGINNKNDVIGFSGLKIGQLERLVLFANGHAQDLRIKATNAYEAINNKLQIVGNSNDGPFVYEHGNSTVLRDVIPSLSQYSQVYALGINDFGQILCNCHFKNAYDGSLLLTPIIIFKRRTQLR
jgi:probable HAF family extracellular repeat protein